MNCWSRGKCQAGLVGVGLALLVFVTVQFREPTSKGKPLTYWLTQINRGTEVEKSSEAIREMGSQCLPLLGRQIGSRESHLHASARELLAKRVNLKLRDPEELEMASFYVLAEFDEAAKPVFERIDFNHPRAQHFVWALGGCRLAAREALVRACDSTNQEVRTTAAFVLATLKDKPAPGFWQWHHSGGHYGMNYAYKYDGAWMKERISWQTNDPSVAVRTASEEWIAWWTQEQKMFEQRISALNAVHEERQRAIEQRK